MECAAVGGCVRSVNIMKCNLSRARTRYTHTPHTLVPPPLPPAHFSNVRYDASFLTFFQRRVIYAPGESQKTSMYTTLQDIFAAPVCKSLVACILSRAFYRPATRNLAIHVPLIITIFDPPRRRAAAARRGKWREKEKEKKRAHAQVYTRKEGNKNVSLCGGGFTNEGELCAWLCVLKMRLCAFAGRRSFVIALWVRYFSGQSAGRLTAAERAAIFAVLTVGKRLAVCRQIQPFAQMFHARARARVNSRTEGKAWKKRGQVVACKFSVYLQYLEVIIERQLQGV